MLNAVALCIFGFKEQSQKFLVSKVAFLSEKRETLRTPNTIRLRVISMGLYQKHQMRYLGLDPFDQNFRKFR